MLFWYEYNQAIPASPTWPEEEVIKENHIVKIVMVFRQIKKNIEGKLGFITFMHGYHLWFWQKLFSVDWCRNLIRNIYTYMMRFPMESCPAWEVLSTCAKTVRIWNSRAQEQTLCPTMSVPNCCPKNPYIYRNCTDNCTTSVWRNGMLSGWISDQEIVDFSTVYIHNLSLK